jgi:alkylation response protein AidB-like acyl-CoA dehydrogenase
LNAVRREPMKRVECSDGEVFQAETAAGIVEQMRSAEWHKPPKKREYMEEIQERVEQMTGVSVRVDRPTHFLKDLEAAGVLRITAWDEKGGELDPEQEVPAEEAPGTTAPTHQSEPAEEWNQLEVNDGE